MLIFSTFLGLFDTVAINKPKSQFLCLNTNCHEKTSSTLNKLPGALMV